MWRNYEEVFDLGQDGATVLAATNGGLLRAGRPVDSPPSLRSIESIRPLVVRLADGRMLREEAGRWVTASGYQRPRELTKGVLLEAEANWPLGTPSPPAHPYTAFRQGDLTLVGTEDGLYRWAGDEWKRETLPSDLPLARPNGIARQGDTYVVGGLGGLFVGRPGRWRQGSSDAIRQIVTIGHEIWVVHGNGAVDKVEPAEDRLYPDLLAGNARRPWTSSVGTADGLPLFGGQGGWTERNGIDQFPAELKGDVVTAILGRGTIRWVGTQKHGLLRFGPRGKRYWNPGNGLRDVWVTALSMSPKGLMIGTSHEGLFLLHDDRLVSIPSPTARVTALIQWRGRWVVGGMDGAWIQSGSRWESLATQGEETTALTVLGGRLVVAAAAGVYFFGR